MTTGLYVGIQAAVVEGVGPLRAWGRSVSLTRGARWQILALVVVLHALPFLATVSVREGSLFEGSRWESPTARLFFERGLEVLFASLQAVAAAVTYHALRWGPKGVTDDLLTVFE